MCVLRDHSVGEAERLTEKFTIETRWYSDYSTGKALSASDQKLGAYIRRVHSSQTTMLALA